MKPKPTPCKWCGREILPRYLCQCPSAMRSSEYRVQTATGFRWTRPGAERKK